MIFLHGDRTHQLEMLFRKISDDWIYNVERMDDRNDRMVLVFSKQGAPVSEVEIDIHPDVTIGTTKHDIIAVYDVGADGLTGDPVFVSCYVSAIIAVAVR